MTVTINGSGSITEEITIDGVKVGQGAGNVSSNTAVGASALAANTTGAENSALGDSALVANTSGNYNTAVGRVAMQLNTTGSANTVVGRQALNQNTTGSNNTAVGYTALLSNTTATNNTAVGHQAGYSNTVASYNTFIGNAAGYTFNGSGNSQNVFVGHNSGYSSTSNTTNTFVGNQSGYTVTTGSGNTFFGYNSGQAMSTGSKNTIIGGYDGNSGGLDIRTASNYIVLSDGDGNPRIYVDNNGVVYMNGNGYVQTSSNQTIRFPSTGGTGYVGNITSANAFQISYNSTAAGVQLTSGATSWGTFSDSRLKNVTGTYTNALADIAQIEPVKFTWKSDLENKPQVGVLAQSVQNVVPEAIELSTIEMDGTEEYLTVRYTELIPLMIASIQELKAEVDSLKAQLNK